MKDAPALCNADYGYSAGNLYAKAFSRHNTDCDCERCVMQAMLDTLRLILQELRQPKATVPKKHVSK